MKGMDILFGQSPEEWHFPDFILSSVTPIQVSQTVAQIAHHLYPNAHVVWDLFGGTGMDTVNFSKFFETITCESDPQMFLAMSQNILIHHDSAHDYELHRVDSTSFKPLYRSVDLVYLDPPWGEGFKRDEPFDMMGLQIGTRSLMSIIEDIRRDVCQNIILKAPIKNYDLWKDRIQCEIQFDRYRLKFYFLT